jgi:ABC-type lipoprotein export system ATPase subunit
MSVAILRAENLHLQYGETTLLREVNLTLKKGKIISISSEIGLGKTSLLRVLGLLSKPSAGQLYIKHSIDCVPLPRAELDEFIKHYFAYVFQTPKLMMQWTALENISLPLIAMGYTKAEREQKAHEYYSAVGLKEKDANKPVSILSVGTKKLVGIARALAKEPMILIADEPTANLDPNTRERIIELFRRKAEEKNMAIIVATHVDTKTAFSEQYVIQDERLVQESLNI